MGHVRVSFCVAGAAFAAAPSCVECHSIWDTLHFTLYTLYTLHFTLYTLHFTLYTLYTLHFTLYTLHFALYTPHSTLYTPLSTLYTLHFTLHTLHFALYTPHSALCTLHSTLYKIDGRLARNIDFEVANCEVHEKIVRFMREFYEVFLSMCFDICAINIRVSIRVRRLHLVSYTVYASDVYVRYKSVCDWVWIWYRFTIPGMHPNSQICWLNQQIWIVYPALLGIPRLSQLSEGLIFHAGENGAVATQNYCTISGNMPAIHRSPMNSEATVDIGQWPPGSQRPH